MTDSLPRIAPTTGSPRKPVLLQIVTNWYTTRSRFGTRNTITKSQPTSRSKNPCAIAMANVIPTVSPASAAESPCTDAITMQGSVMFNSSFVSFWFVYSSR